MKVKLIATLMLIMSCSGCAALDKTFDILDTTFEILDILVPIDEQVEQPEQPDGA